MPVMAASIWETTRGSSSDNGGRALSGSLVGRAKASFAARQRKRNELLCYLKPALSTMTYHVAPSIAILFGVIKSRFRINHGRR